MHQQNLSGTVASFIDNNVPGSNIRGAVASSGIIEDPDVAESWNKALDVSDKASMVQGTVEVIGGEGLKDGGTALTIGSGGTASEISLPAIGVGLGMQVHGAFVTAKAASSLATQNGRVHITQSDNSSGSSQQNNNQPANSNTSQSKVEKSKKVEKIGDKFTRTTEVRPGKGPGQSRAEYVRYKNRQGKVIRTYKDSYDRRNKFQGRKPLRGGPEGRPVQ